MNSEHNSDSNSGRKDQRNRSDNAIAVERQRVDKALRRNENADIAWLIQEEREQTDRRIQEERSSADQDSENSSDVLSKELESHRKTQANLVSRDEFLAIVSHDLKNPIGTISSCGEMLLNDPLYQDIDAKVKPWITLMKRNADSALALIRDLLDMERMAQGRITLQTDSYDINDLIRESVESFAVSASMKKILLRAFPTVGLSKVICDRDRILQVISNLIGNALKFTPDGGSIFLRMSTTNKNCIVSIADTGPGIPAEKQARIFERFTQLGVNDRQGLGLGLYISKMIIESHEGRLWVNSELGAGSVFSFTLLLAPQAHHR